MAVTGKLYGKVFLASFNKEIDWDTDTIKCSLHTSTYVPDQDVHDYFNDATNEVTGTGYTAGGATLAGKTITYTGATNKITLDANDATWSSATITARVAVVYDAQTGVATTEPLICYQLSDADITSTNGTYTVSWNANGIAEISVS
jgi:hypothetical protein